MYFLKALRVSMEEQRQRQEEEQRRAQAESAQEIDPAGQAPAIITAAPTSDEAMLERALALSTETPVKRHRVRFVSVLSFLVSYSFAKFLCLFENFLNLVSFTNDFSFSLERRNDARLLKHDRRGTDCVRYANVNG
jgi:hypothetical protein